MLFFSGSFKENGQSELSSGFISPSEFTKTTCEEFHRSSISEFCSTEDTPEHLGGHSVDWVVSVQQEGGQRVYFSYVLHESSPRGSKLCGDRSVLGNPSWVGKLECIRVKASPPVTSQELAWILVPPSVSLSSRGGFSGEHFLQSLFCLPGCLL